MKIYNKINQKSFLIYGLGKTGISSLRFLKKQKVKKIICWDDNKSLRRKFNIKDKFIESIKREINSVDFIVMSPGINFRKCILYKELNINFSRLITDLDLFYIFRNPKKTILVTGTNGKSTTTALIHHLFNKNKIQSIVGGNIGIPILGLKNINNKVIIIEASSFQLFYSKYLKPDHSIFLNFFNNHLDWHKNIQEYLESKLAIFKHQSVKQFAYIMDSKIIKKFKKRKFLPKLIKVQLSAIKKIKKKLNNAYFENQINDQNICFVKKISEHYKISNQNFIKALNSFQGLAHRHEVIFQKKGIKVINDSKSTSAISTMKALEGKNNIILILGGLPKKLDKLKIQKFKQNILNIYLIGKHTNFFKKQLIGFSKLSTTQNLKETIKKIKIYLTQSIISKKNYTILFSPAAASYDQFNNFEERGDYFKFLCKKYLFDYL